MTIRLIINADDYGRTVEISRGIRHAHLHGMVTSTTCLMNMPTVVDDIKFALNETPLLGMGVHLVLTAGKPMLPAEKVPGLVSPDGFFLKREVFFGAHPGVNCGNSKRQINLSEVKAEWHAQIEAFISAAGKLPTHLDSHHHSSYSSVDLFTGMLELAREYKLPIRLPLAHNVDLFETVEVDDESEDIRDFAPRLLQKFQPQSPDALFTSFFDKQATRTEIFRITKHFFPNGVFEIMSHPGFVDVELSRESSYSHQRENELEILTDPEMRKEFERLGIKLISFAEL